LSEFLPVRCAASLVEFLHLRLLVASARVPATHDLLLATSSAAMMPQAVWLLAHRDAASSAYLRHWLGRSVQQARVELPNRSSLNFRCQQWARPDRRASLAALHPMALVALMLRLVVRLPQAAQRLEPRATNRAGLIAVERRLIGRAQMERWYRQIPAANRAGRYSPRCWLLGRAGFVRSRRSELVWPHPDYYSKSRATSRAGRRPNWQGCLLPMKACWLARRLRHSANRAVLRRLRVGAAQDFATRLRSRAGAAAAVRRAARAAGFDCRQIDRCSPNAPLAVKIRLVEPKQDAHAGYNRAQRRANQQATRAG